MKKYDLIVAGGGFSGTAAAIAAARAGLSVLLVEKGNSLGGCAVNCIVNPFMNFRTKIGEEVRPLSRGIFEEIYNNLNDMGALKYKDTFNEEYLKIILNRMVLSSGCGLLFHSYLIGAERKGYKIYSITVANKTGQMKLEADYFIDATGDAQLAYLSEYPYRLGRESDNLCQPMTLTFRLGNVDTEKFKKEKDAVNKLYNKYQAEGKIKNLREDVLTFPSTLDGVLHFNTTRIVKLNPTNALDVTRAEIEAREQIFELVDMLRTNFESFKNSQVLMSASEIGVRESRMIEGEYTLNKDDLVECRKFDDSIALGNYDIDIHNPEGSGTSHYYFKAGEYYTIPYRCLIPKGAENLLVAGRCISATHEAQASIRIMPIVCCIGEAAGEAAALAKKSGKNVSGIDTDVLRNNLKKNNAAC